jgi:cyanophycinase-like exopeptidase
MEKVDAELLEGRPRRAVVLPTAAALEGDARVAYWLELGRTHYEALGVESVGLDVRTRADAADPAVVARVRGAGLVYLSGGDPHHLSDTLRSTPLWDAVQLAWHEGAAVAGCSAGAMALTSGAPDDLFAPESSSGRGGRAAPDPATEAGPGVASGLGLVAGLAVIPHFDWMQRWRPNALARVAAWQPPGTTLLGIDDNTALVTTALGWRVRGDQAVWVLAGDARAPYRDGDEVPLAAPVPGGG